MNALQALKDLPGLIERKIALQAGLDEIEAGIAAAVAALGPQGWHYQQLVQALCRPDASAAPAAAVAAPPVGDLPVDERDRIELVRMDDPPWEEPAVLVADSAAPVYAPLEPVSPAAEAVSVLGDPVADAGDPVVTGGEPIEPPAADAEPAPDPDPDEEGWVSCKAYGQLCGVSEPVIYSAITKGVIHGPAVRLGPPKRVRPELADRQILQNLQPSLLRANVAKRVERTVVIEQLPAEERAFTAFDAARFLRAKGYQVLELGAESFKVDGVATTRARLIERATEIGDRDERLARAKRSAA